MLINDSKQTFCMDGTTAIKDTVHDLAATVTDTPTFETLLGVQAPIIPAGTTNLLPLETASFESGTTGGWNGINCTLTNSTVWSRVGTKSLKCAPTGSPEIYYDVTAITTAGQYTLSAWLKSAATSKKFRFTVYDNVSGIQNSALTDITGLEQRKAFTFNFGVGSTLRYIYIDRQNLAAGDDFYVDGIKLEAGAVATPFDLTISWPTASIGLIPGMPFSIVAAVDTNGTQWNDGVPHIMFITRDGIACNGGFELYKSAFGFVSINTWLNGDDKWTAIGLTAENWAPGKHVVAAIIDEYNNQRIFLDGIEGFTSQGSCGREEMLGTNSYIGIHDDGIFPLDGSELSTIYGRVLTDDEIALVSSTTLWTDLIDPPKPVTHKAEKKSAYVSILDPTGATPLARLTEHFPATGWTPDIFENLSFESVNRGGYTVASFTIHRPVTQFWADLQYRNQVIIGRGSEIYWEGYIAKPVRSIRPDVIEVNCLGWSAELNQLWTASDITAPVGGYKMSTFVNAVLLIDPNTSIVAGMMETGDYVYPEGTLFEFANKYYFDALEELDAGNNFNWGVWGNKAIDLRAKHASVDWLVWTGDCEDLTISPNPDAIANYVNVHFTQDGTHYEDAVVFDTPSSLLYGWRMVNISIPGKIDESSIAVGPPPLPGGATHIAEVYLAEHKDLKVAAEFTCNRIFDSYGAEQYLGKVRGGEVVRIVDWLPTEETLGGVNDIATFEIKSPKYDHDSDTLAITPTEFLPSTDIQIARLQAVGY